MFTRAQPRAPDAGELAGSTDWLWMSLMRAGRKAEANAMLARRPDSLVVDNAYRRRLTLYRGEIGPDAVFTPADTADVQVATLSYGLGNWYLVRGDTRAREDAFRAGGAFRWLAGFRVHGLGGGAAAIEVSAMPCHPEERSDEGSRLRLSWAGSDSRKEDPSLTLGMTSGRA